MTFNLPNVSSLNLTMDTITAIYQGHVTSWNSSAIQRWNPRVQLPASDIHVIKCVDTCSVSGTLSRLPRPASGEARATRVHSDAAVMQRVSATTYSVGYVHLPDAVYGRLTYAALVDSTGRSQSPSNIVETAMADVTNRTATKSSSVRLRGAHPLVTFVSYVVKLDDTVSCESAVELYRYVQWVTRDPLARLGCRRMRFVPLLTRLRDVVDERVLKRLTCERRRRLVADAARAQRLAESAVPCAQAYDWKIVLLWIFGVATFLCVVLLARVAWLRMRTFETTWKTDWKIPMEQVTFPCDARRSRASVHPTDRVRASLSSLGRVGDNGVFSHLDVVSGKFHGENVTLRPCSRVPNVRLTLVTRRLLLWMRDVVSNPNVLRFHGVVERRARCYIVSEHCSRGQLRDVIHDAKYHLNDNFKFSMSCDIADGVAYLHNRDIVLDGLSPSCCFIDSHWTVKIGDWEFYKLERVQGERVLLHWQAASSGLCDEDCMAADRFYTSPELLQLPYGSPSRESDAYSYAVLIIEIFSRKPPFWRERATMKPSEILSQVSLGRLAPSLPAELPDTLGAVVRASLAIDPYARPTFAGIVAKVSGANPSRQSVLDCMMESVEGYVSRLEELVDDRTDELNTALKVRHVRISFIESFVKNEFEQTPKR